MKVDEVVEKGPFDRKTTRVKPCEYKGVEII